MHAAPQLSQCSCFSAPSSVNYREGIGIRHEMSMIPMYVYQCICLTRHDRTGQESTRETTGQKAGQDRTQLLPLECGTGCTGAMTLRRLFAMMPNGRAWETRCWVRRQWRCLGKTWACSMERSEAGAWRVGLRWHTGQDRTGQDFNMIETLLDSFVYSLIVYLVWSLSSCLSKDLNQLYFA